MKKSMLMVLAAAAIFVVACGSGGGDQTTKYVGTWTFSSGQLTPMCTLIKTPFSLTGISVMFAKVDDSTISLGIGTACTVKFKVSGDNATAEAGQTCTLDVASFGPEQVAINSWTLALSGDQIQNMISGSIVICTASGTAVLTRGAPDGGAPDAAVHEGGATEAGRDVSATDGGATEVAADAAVTEGGGTETGAETGSIDGGAIETGTDGGAMDAVATEASAAATD